MMETQTIRTNMGISMLFKSWGKRDALNFPKNKFSVFTACGNYLIKKNSCFLPKSVIYTPQNLICGDI